MKNEYKIIKKEVTGRLILVTYRMEDEILNRTSHGYSMEEVYSNINKIISHKKNWLNRENWVVTTKKHSNSGRYFVNNRGVSVEE
jgi:hypothetical protein